MNQITNTGFNKTLSTFSILALLSGGSLITTGLSTAHAEGKKNSAQVAKVAVPAQVEIEDEETMELPGIFKTLPAEGAESTQKQTSHHLAKRQSDAQFSADLNKVAWLAPKRLEKKEESNSLPRRADKRENDLIIANKPEAKTIIIPKTITSKEAGEFHATAYCLKGRTATGEYVRRGIVAADPKILPLGTLVHIEAGKYSGVYKVADTGGAIRGRRIDIYVPSYSEAVSFGRKKIKIKVLGR
ncbi:MAG: 3D domain-containing protein [Acidobacteriota bacterium]